MWWRTDRRRTAPFTLCICCGRAANVALLRLQIVVKRTAGHDMVHAESFRRLPHCQLQLPAIVDGADLAACHLSRSCAYDHLNGLKQRASLPKFPEPQVALIFDSYGGVDKALQYLKTATRDNPTNPNIFNDLGNVWRVKGESYLAVECFRKALALDAQNPDALLNLACVLQNAGHPQDAEGLLRIALDIVPNSVLHHFTLGNVLVSQHRADAAAQSFQTALSIQPNFVLAQDSLIDLISQGWLPALNGQPGGGSLLGHQRKALPVDPVHLVQGLPAASQHSAYPGSGRATAEQTFHQMQQSSRYEMKPPSTPYVQQVVEMLLSHAVPIVVSIVIVTTLATWSEQRANQISGAQEEPARGGSSSSRKNTTQKGRVPKR